MYIVVQYKSEYSDRRITCEVEPTDSLASLKDLLLDQEGIVVGEGKLTLRGKTLDDDQTTFQSFQVQDGDVFDLVWSFHITIKNGESTTSINVSPDDYVSIIRKKVFQLDETFFPEKQRLVHRGKVFRPDALLSEYNIQEGDMIFIAPAFSGGGQVERVAIARYDWDGAIQSYYIKGLPLFRGQIIRSPRRPAGGWYATNNREFFPTGYVQVDEVDQDRLDRLHPQAPPDLSFLVEPPPLPPLPPTPLEMFKVKLGSRGLSFMQLEMQVIEWSAPKAKPEIELRVSCCPVPPSRICSAVISLEFESNKIHDLQPVSEVGYSETETTIETTNNRTWSVNIKPEFEGFAIAGVGWEKGKTKTKSSTRKSRMELSGVVLAPCTARWTIVEDVGAQQGIPNVLKLYLCLDDPPDRVRVQMEVRFTHNGRIKKASTEEIRTLCGHKMKGGR